MAESPPIHTDRLRIVPLGETHLTPRYVGWLNDADLMRYSEQRHRRHSLETCRAYLASFEGTPDYFWAIEEIREGLGHIGNLNAYVDSLNLVADLGIVIGERAAGGRGYGLEAWRAVCEFLLMEGGLRKISAGTLAVNRPMCALARAVGMKEDGIRRRHCLWDGQEVDVVHFALFREDWRRLEAVRIGEPAP